MNTYLARIQTSGKFIMYQSPKKLRLHEVVQIDTEDFVYEAIIIQIGLPSFN